MKMSPHFNKPKQCHVKITFPNVLVFFNENNEKIN